MKYYTTGLIFLLFSFGAILLLLNFGKLTRQVEKNIEIVENKISNLNDKIQVNELEYVAHTSHNYLKKLEQLYLTNNYNLDEDIFVVAVDYYFKIINVFYSFCQNASIFKPPAIGLNPIYTQCYYMK